MSSYVVVSSNDTACCGPYSTKELALAAAINLANTYVAGNPDLSVKSNTDVVVAVLTMTRNTELYTGIDLTYTSQQVSNKWNIEELSL